MNPDKRRSMVGLLGATLMALATGAFAATPVPGGKWSWVWNDAKGNADRPMRVYTYRPQACDSSCPIVIVLNGASRNAADYRDYWELPADRYKFLVIAPEFSQGNWPGEGYNLGGAGKEPNKEKWVFATIEHLFDEMRVDQASYVLFGHSAGAQVAHRMALLRPENRASAIVAANAGWYTMPEWRKEKAKDPFPYSLVNSASGEAELRKALARRMIVMAGEKDVDPNADKLNKSEGAMKEGANRLDRAESFFKAATASANDLGVKLAWELVEVPGVAHDGKRMSKAAADALFKKK